RDSADRGAAWGLATAAAAGVIALLCAAAGKRGRAAAPRAAALTALAGLLLYAADLFLRLFTIYNLPVAASRALKRLGELAGGRRAASYLWELPGRHPEILVLGAVLAGGIVLLYLAAGRWSRRRAGRGGAAVGGVALLVLAALNLVPLFFAAPTGPNVLLIVVDCLRADRLEGNEDVSNLNAFSRESLRFPRVWANAPWTKPAMASLLSSLPPTRHGAMNPLSALPRGITTLPEIFREHGYRTFFINGGNPNLTPEFGFGQGFDRLEVTDRRFGPDCNRALFRRLAQTGNEPFFGLVHYMDLHLPYNVNPDNPPPPEPLPDGLRPGTLDYDRVIAEAGREPVRSYLRALYRGQLRFVDSLLGEV
ncbi:MAG TPA: sulfatase-like hydrolase/transferase, partial [bacterium]|nr:sulfatase-like hydrolase/transferase [bacterium]